MFSNIAVNFIPVNVYFNLFSLNVVKSTFNRYIFM